MRWKASLVNKKYIWINHIINCVKAVQNKFVKRLTEAEQMISFEEKQVQAHKY